MCVLTKYRNALENIPHSNLSKWYIRGPTYAFLRLFLGLPGCRPAFRPLGGVKGSRSTILGRV